MTLNKLLAILRQTQGAGCPVALKTPDGREWEPGSTVTTTIHSDEHADSMKTVIELVEVKS